MVHENVGTRRTAGIIIALPKVITLVTSTTAAITIVNASNVLVRTLIVASTVHLPSFPF